MATSNLAGWSIDSSDLPKSAGLKEKVRFALRYAILAPSSHNTQPWRFPIIGNELLVCADRTRNLPNIDPFDRELIISCGAALFNLRVAFAALNIPLEDFDLSPQRRTGHCRTHRVSGSWRGA